MYNKILAQIRLLSSFNQRGITRIGDNSDMKKASGNHHSIIKSPSMQGCIDIGGNESVTDGQKEGWLEKQQAIFPQWGHKQSICV